MSLTFVDIEQRKNRSIWLLAVVVILFYFLTGYLILIVLRFSCRTVFNPHSLSSLLLPSPRETIYMVLSAAIIGLGHWYFSTRNLFEKIAQLIGAEHADPSDAYHQLYTNIVDEVVVATGSRPLEALVIPISGLQAFALADFNGRAAIGVTEGLLARLNRSQIEAVVAHEAAHIVSGDCLDVTVTCSLGELYDELYERLKIPMGKADRFFPLVLALFSVVALSRLLSLVMRAFISREREYRADALAVRMTRDPLSLAEALKMIGRSWRGAGVGGAMLQAIFIVNPRDTMLDESESAAAQIFSSHPPLRRRVAILLDMLHMPPQALEERLDKIRHVPPVPQTVEGFPLPRIVLPPLSRNTALPSDTASGGSVLCPQCAVPLSPVSYEGAPLLECPRCRGRLVRTHVVTRILVRKDLVYSEATLRLSKQIMQDAQHFSLKVSRVPKAWVLTCPECRQQMHREFFVYSYPVQVDRCILCKTVWFDLPELEVLQYLSEHNQEFIHELNSGEFHGNAV